MQPSSTRVQTVGVLETKPGSSGRVASTLNHWAIFLDLRPCVKERGEKKGRDGERKIKEKRKGKLGISVWKHTHWCVEWGLKELRFSSQWWRQVQAIGGAQGGMRMLRVAWGCSEWHGMLRVAQGCSGWHGDVQDGMGMLRVARNAQSWDCARTCTFDCFSQVSSLYWDLLSSFSLMSHEYLLPGLVPLPWIHTVG